MTATETEDGMNIVFDINDPDWRLFPRTKLQALGISPSQLWHNASAELGALVVQRSPKYENYAISQSGIEYLHSAERDGKIKCGVVVLMAKREIITQKPVVEVVAALDGVAVRESSDPRFGPYWLFNADLTPFDNDWTPF
jgi:hypothetical protein